MRVANISLNPANLYRLGTLMIWLGVLTWVPFLLLRSLGERPSLFWFLPIHLLGVIGGSRLRAYARRDLDTAPRNTSLRIIGHGLIWLGIAVWLPYFFLRYALNLPVQVMQFLPFHLAGVLSGVMVLGIVFIKERTGNNTR
jgi:polyferredoxin